MLQGLGLISSLFYLVGIVTLKSPSWTTSAATDEEEEKKKMVYEHSQLLDYWIWTQQFPVPFCEAHIKKMFVLFHVQPFHARARSILQSTAPVLEGGCVNTTRSNCCATMIPSVLSEVIDIHHNCVFLLQLSPKEN